MEFHRQINQKLDSVYKIVQNDPSFSETRFVSTRSAFHVSKMCAVPLKRQILTLHAPCLICDPLLLQ